MCTKKLHNIEFKVQGYTQESGHIVPPWEHLCQSSRILKYQIKLLPQDWKFGETREYLPSDSHVC